MQAKELPFTLISDNKQTCASPSLLSNPVPCKVNWLLLFFDSICINMYTCIPAPRIQGLAAISGGNLFFQALFSVKCTGCGFTTIYTGCDFCWITVVSTHNCSQDPKTDYHNFGRKHFLLSPAVCRVQWL